MTEPAFYRPLLCSVPHCNGAMLLIAHEADSDRLTYLLQCDLAGHRLREFPGRSVHVYLRDISEEPAMDAGGIEQGYLPPAYLRWAGVPVETLESVYRRGPRYCWVVKGSSIPVRLVPVSFRRPIF